MTLRRLPTGFVGAVLLIALFEHAVSRHELTTAGPVAWDWRITGKEASRKALDRDVLLFGDSLVKLGLHPATVARASGRTVYSLAVSGCQAPATYYMFKKALDAGARPKAVVVDFKLDLLSKDASYAQRQWPELLDLHECIEMAAVKRDAGFLAATVLAETLPSYKGRHDIRAVLFDRLKARPVGHALENLAFQRQWRLNDGGQIFDRNPAFRDVTLPETIHPGSWAPDPVNVTYVRKFLELANRHGIVVYWINMPTSPTVREVFERNGDLGRYRVLVRTLRNENPNLVLLDTLRGDYGPEVFVDVVHLDRHGAWLLSESVGSVLRRGDSVNLAHGRIDIPRHRDRPGEGPFEDFNASRLAVERRLGTMRR